MEHLNQSAKAATGYTVTGFHVPFLYHSHHKDSNIKTRHWRLFDIFKQVPAADWVFPFTALIFHTEVSGGKHKLHWFAAVVTGELKCPISVLRDENTLN